MPTTHLRISGMTSVHAIRAIQTALAMVDGLTHIDLSLGRATIEHDGRATEAALRDCIAVAGYEVTEVVEERRRLRVV